MSKKIEPMEEDLTVLAPTQQGSMASVPSAADRRRDPLVDELIATALPEADTALRFEDLIQQGGEGSISVAFDPTLQRRVAVKSMHKSNQGTAMLVRGFLREAQIIAQLDHPNIVAIHKLAKDPDLGLHFSMGLVEGQNLTEFLASAETPGHESLVNFLEVVIKVCNALSFAHSRGVVHCDLKPANIMVGDHGQVYVMDWGGASLLSCWKPDPDPLYVRDTLPQLPSETTRGMVFGTPSYMAPEQARGELVDHRADIFSMGALLYKYISGRAPFAADSAAIGIQHAQVCHYRPLDERLYTATLPQELFAITERAMAANRDDRYQSIKEFRDALRSLIHGSGSFPTVTFAAGESIISEGDHGDAGYILTTGEVDVFKTVNGNKVPLRRMVPGDVFGETAIFAATPRTASVVALTQVELVCITEDVVKGELNAMKPWMAAFVRMLAERFQDSEATRLGSKKQV